MRKLLQVVLGGLEPILMWVEYFVHQVALLHVLVHEDISDQSQSSIILECFVSLLLQ